MSSYAETVDRIRQLAWWRSEASVIIPFVRWEVTYPIYSVSGVLFIAYVYIAVALGALSQALVGVLGACSCPWTAASLTALHAASVTRLLRWLLSWHDPTAEARLEQQSGREAAAGLAQLLAEERSISAYAISQEAAAAVTADAGGPVEHVVSGRAPAARSSLRSASECGLESA
jgi:hypothetical protein